MSESTLGPSGAAATRRFVAGYGVAVIGATSGLALSGSGSSAFGVMLAGAAYALIISRSSRSMSRPLSGSLETPGMLVFASTQATVGTVVIVVGFLIRGAVTLTVSAAGGTLLYSSSAFLIYMRLMVGRKA